MSMMIGFLLGSFVVVFIYSRILLWLGNKIFHKKYYILSNVLALLLASAMYGYSSVEGYPNFVFSFMNALLSYALPQFICLAMDFAKFRKAIK